MDLSAGPRPIRFMTAAILLGIGLGGFVDGIVLHQILQWHHMISTPVPPSTTENLQLNTLADGLFHGATWIVTLAGVLLLAGARRLPQRPTRAVFGGLLTGWGLFNLVEGVVNHRVLELHHVRPGPDELLWDLGFLAWGAVMLVIGGWMLRRVRSG